MSEEYKSNIVSKADLGNGQKQVTLSIDPDSLNKYFQSNDSTDTEKPDKLAKGSVMSRYEKTSESYLSQFSSNDVPYTTALKAPTDPHQKIRLATELYYKEPMVGTVVDMMVDFSASGFTNECEDKEVKDYFDRWAREINLSELIEQIFLEYYRSSNVSLYRNKEDMTIRKTEVVKNKSIAKAEYSFPSGYTILNPMNVHFKGTLLFGSEQPYLSVNEDMTDMVTNGSPAQLKLLPPDLIKAVRAGDTMFPLDKELFHRITRKRQPYERYATPSLERVFEPILYKQKLRSMDMSTIEGLVNQLVTVTIGSDEYPATDDDLLAIAELFQTPNKAYTVFWNHTLKVEFHKPVGIETLDQDKYKQVNEDILMGLGISRALIDGQGGNLSSSWVSILSLIERLENTRGQVQYWLEQEYKRIADVNGFKVVPKVQFSRMNLREDNYIRDVLLAMYDRGLIDEENLLQETGRDYNSIIETKKRNKKNADLFLPPEQPFQGGNTSPNDGRPNGSNKNGYKERESSPEQNEGNAPKAKANVAYAYYSQVEEEYNNEIVNFYKDASKEIANLVEENKDNNSDILIASLTGSIIGLFKSLGYIGDRYIEDIYNYEISTYRASGNTDSSKNLKKNLKDWNKGYVNKLAVDIANIIADNIREGNAKADVVEKVFASNLYRINAMSEAVVIDSLRQAKIHGNLSEGKASATWICHLDDRTCSTCRGLNGKSFGISDIPPRPHTHCRCDLDFN